MYSNLPKGELNAVLEWKAYPMVCGGSEVYGSIQFRKDVLYFWHGPCEFSDYFIGSSVMYCQTFSSIAFRYHYNGG